MEKKYQKLAEGLGKGRVKFNEPMSLYTTFKIGGPADLFYEVKTARELVKAVGLTRRLQLPFFILGGGSNILVSDQGIRGLVIKIKSAKLKIKNGLVEVEAGMSLPWLVEETAKRGLAGLEFCAGIPGTVGGAIVGNAGTKDKWIGDRVIKVEVLGEEGKVKKVLAKNCQFGYRESRFKNGQEVVLSAILRLVPGNPKNIKKKIGQSKDERKNQPKQPSGGSIFKNPSDNSAGRLIDQAGLKGCRIGKAQISPQHANFIVNLGGTSCQDVLKLISLAKKRVKEKFGVSLKEEIKIVGEF